MTAKDQPKIIARGPEIGEFLGKPIFAYILEETGHVYYFERTLPEAERDDDVAFLQALALLPETDVVTNPGIVYRRKPISGLSDL
jgi:hypothetical protein